MKFLIFSLLLATFSPIAKSATSISPNLLLIDSSFAPLKADKFDLEKSTCPVISESGELTKDQDECFGSDEWKESQNYDSGILKGMMNTLGGIDGADNSKWKEFNATKPDVAKKIRNSYILSVHGSRASYIAYNYSEKKAEILPLRVVTANTGNTKQAQIIKVKENKNLKVYSKDCQLINWPKKEIELFHSHKKLQPYQDKISKILNDNPAIKVISISLGYKKSWIQEDNAKCDPASVEKEYQILSDSWSNLLGRFKDRLFVVAAGNEGVNFDNTADKNDDLLATLNENDNLILVGSLKTNGERFPSSNYGTKVLMVKGEEIDTLSPLPKESGGYKTTVRGTSFSAPIVAGIATKIFNEKPEISIKELRVIVEKAAKAVK